MLISICFSINSFAQDLHFVYVRFENTMDTEILKDQIEKLIIDFSDSDFILYYSNESATMDGYSWNKRELFRQINSQNSSIPISPPDELEKISIPLEQHLQDKSYSDLYFHCCIGSKFFDNDFHNKLFARMFIVNSLIPSKYNIYLRYYPCGDFYNPEKIQFDTEYNINLIPKIISSL